MLMLHPIRVQGPPTCCVVGQSHDDVENVLPERVCCVSFGFWIATGSIALTQDSFGSGPDVDQAHRGGAGASVERALTRYESGPR